MKELTELENNTLIEIYTGAEFTLKLLAIKLEAWDLEAATEILKTEVSLKKKRAKLRPHT
jgi:hypothetical protein